MDLGIKGKKAIVCAASKGLGRGCAESLAKEGVDVTICARTAARRFCGSAMPTGSSANMADTRLL